MLLDLWFNQFRPTIVDTHDGYFRKLWEQAAKRELEKLEPKVEIEQIEAEIEVVKSAPLPKTEIYIKSVAMPPIEARAMLIESLILRAEKLRGQIEDEDEEEILLML